MDYLKRRAINQLIPDIEELKKDYQVDRGYLQAIECCDKIRKANRKGFTCVSCEELSIKYQKILKERGYSVSEKGDNMNHSYHVEWGDLIQ